MQPPSTTQRWQRSTGAGARVSEPRPGSFFFSKRSLIFFHRRTPLKIKEGTWNRAARRQRPASVANRRPSRRPSRQPPPEPPTGGGAANGPCNSPTTQRPTANGGRLPSKSGDQREGCPEEQDTGKASLSANGYLYTSLAPLPPTTLVTLHATWRHTHRCPFPSWSVKVMRLA